MGPTTDRNKTNSRCRGHTGQDGVEDGDEHPDACPSSIIIIIILFSKLGHSNKESRQ